MGRNCINLLGMRFKKLLVISIDPNKNHHWICECDCLCICEDKDNCTCGLKNIKSVNSSNLRSNHTKSCGCLKSESVGDAQRKHGDKHTKSYGIYSSMKQRCTNLNHQSSKDYIDRGIKVCDRWLGENGYINFKEDMYESYIKHVEEFGHNNTSLDRIDNNGNYEPSNTKWSTRSEQMGNTRKSRWFKATRLSDKYEEISKNQYQFSRKYNLRNSEIWKCLKGINRTHQGWIFEYIPEWTYRTLTDDEVKEFIVELL